MAEDRNGPLATGAMIVFIDESGVSQRPVVRRTWAVKAALRLGGAVVYGHFSAIGAIGYHPKRSRCGCFLSLCSRTIKKEDILGFLKSLRRHVHDRVVPGPGQSSGPPQQGGGGILRGSEEVAAGGMAAGVRAGTQPAGGCVANLDGGAGQFCADDLEICGNGCAAGLSVFAATKTCSGAS